MLFRVDGRKSSSNSNRLQFRLASIKFFNVTRRIAHRTENKTKRCFRAPKSFRNLMRNGLKSTKKIISILPTATDERIESKQTLNVCECVCGCASRLNEKNYLKIIVQSKQLLCSVALQVSTEHNLVVHFSPKQIGCVSLVSRLLNDFIFLRSFL